MAWDKEENYAKKKDLEEYTKKNTFNKKVAEIEDTLETKITKEDLPDHSIYALKKDLPTDYLKKDEIESLKKEILDLKAQLNGFVKKTEVPTILYQNAGNIMTYIEPHTNHRYCTNQLFHKIKNDLNVKLKRWIPGWKNV